MCIVHLCFLFVSIHYFGKFIHGSSLHIHTTIWTIWYIPKYSFIDFISSLFFLHLDLFIYFFGGKFKVHSKSEVKVQRFPIHPHPYTCRIFPDYNILCQSSTLATMDESTWHIIITQCPQFILWFSLSVTHSPGWDKYIYLLLWHHTKYFHCPKNTLCSTYSSLPPQP